MTLPPMTDTPPPSGGTPHPHHRSALEDDDDDDDCEPEWAASPVVPTGAGGSRHAVGGLRRRAIINDDDNDDNNDVNDNDGEGGTSGGGSNSRNGGDGSDGDGGNGSGGNGGSVARHYFTCEGLAGVQVQVEVANMEVDEQVCGEDSDEEAEAVVSAVRRWQDPWRKHREMSAPPPNTYSTTPLHPLHPLCGVADPSAINGAVGSGGSIASAVGPEVLSHMWRLDDQEPRSSEGGEAGVGEEEEVGLADGNVGVGRDGTAGAAAAAEGGLAAAAAAVGAAAGAAGFGSAEERDAFDAAAEEREFQRDLREQRERGVGGGVDMSMDSAYEGGAVQVKSR